MKTNEEIEKIEKAIFFLEAYKRGKETSRGFDLCGCTILRGWSITKIRMPTEKPAIIFVIQTPFDLLPDGPWAGHSENICGDRNWALRFLRKHWIPDAKERIEELRDL